ncbi:MAG: SBBP repeat-containing protein, partial [Bryobacteraceae bacterium]
VASDDAFFMIFDLSQTGAASLSYSSYFGGDRSDVGRSIAVGDDGRIYIAGSTFSDDLPFSANSYDYNYQEGGDAFLVVLDLSQAKPVQYFTYFGGSDLEEFMKVRLDSKGRVALTGYTLSTDFPVTPNAFQPQSGGNVDAFLTIFDITQPRDSQLVYSTYLGGSEPEIGLDLRPDATGAVWVTGFTQSIDFPVTAGAAQSQYGGGGGDGFLVHVDPSSAANTLQYGTYIGGPGYNIVYGMEMDKNGNIFLTGSASSVIVPTVNTAQRVSDIGNADTFLLEFSPR